VTLATVAVVTVTVAVAVVARATLAKRAAPVVV
jgi:hypothetical protein